MSDYYNRRIGPVVSRGDRQIQEDEEEERRRKEIQKTEIKYSCSHSGSSSRGSSSNFVSSSWNKRYDGPKPGSENKSNWGGENQNG